MCTVILAVGLREDYPLILGGNRDELLARPWEAPAEYWPGIVGGRDTLAGGTWLALNRAGVVAAVLNRRGTLGPAAGKRSRGELPLMALAQTSAAAAAESLAGLDAGAWRSFNMLVADRAGAFFLRGLGEGAVTAARLGAGYWMTTSQDPNDLAMPRVARHLPRLRAAALPDPARGDFAGWEAVLADDAEPVGSAIDIPPLGGFGTVCSALIALPAGAGAPVFRFAPGRPHATRFQTVLAEVAGSR